MNAEVHVFADAEQVCRTAAERVVQAARSAIAQRGRFTIALSGGSTPRRLYQMLAELPLRDQIDWPSTHVFWGDERSVPPDHADSNYAMAQAALLSKVPVPAAQVHRLQGEAADLKTAAHRYQEEIVRVFGVSASGDSPSLDLVLLGMGADGHTASLFPHTAALVETKRWVTANEVPQLNTRRLTLTAPILNAAAQVLFLVAGTDKAAALQAVLEGPPNPEQYPSQLIRPARGPAVWLIDQAAARRLSPQTLSKG